MQCLYKFVEAVLTTCSYRSVSLTANELCHIVKLHSEECSIVNLLCEQSEELAFWLNICWQWLASAVEVNVHGQLLVSDRETVASISFVVVYGSSVIVSHTGKVSFSYKYVNMDYGALVHCRCWA